MNYWLMKSEPHSFGIDHLAKSPKETAMWDGVRNYQVRNTMRDQMKEGDLAFFYHSNAKPSGIAGIMRLTRGAYADTTQFDFSSKYYDPKAHPEAPRWIAVDVTLIEKFDVFIPLAQLKAHPELASLPMLKQGSRLSITPVEAKQWDLIMAMATAKKE